jgi:hypothetical protein
MTFWGIRIAEVLGFHFDNIPFHSLMNARWDSHHYKHIDCHIKREAPQLSPRQHDGTLKFPSKEYESYTQRHLSSMFVYPLYMVTVVFHLNPPIFNLKALHLQIIFHYSCQSSLSTNPNSLSPSPLTPSPNLTATTLLLLPLLRILNTTRLGANTRTMFENLGGAPEPTLVIQLDRFGCVNAVHAHLTWSASLIQSADFAV